MLSRLTLSRLAIESLGVKEIEIHKRPYCLVFLHLLDMNGRTQCAYKTYKQRVSSYIFYPHRRVVKQRKKAEEEEEEEEENENEKEKEKEKE